MKRKEIVFVKESDGELRAFVAKLRLSGSLELEIDRERLLVEVRVTQPSKGARQAMVRGGPMTDD